MIKLEDWPYQKSGFSNPMMVDYLNDSHKIKPFYKHRPTVDGLHTAIQDKNFQDAHREVLTDELSKQYKKLPNASKQLENIELLKKSNTYTVTTGHQLCMATGPLYSIYKIASTIKLAQELNKINGEHHIVPVFWLASEDHDFEEINFFRLFGKKIEWETESGAAVGRLPLRGIETVVEQLRDILGDQHYGPEMSDKLSQYYHSDSTLGAAYLNLIHDLFAHTGLIIVEADNPQLKTLFAPLMIKEVQEQQFEKKINEASEQLLALGYKKQVTPRPINLFYLTKKARARIIQNGDEYQALGTGVTWSQSQLEDEINAHPDNFSPNAVFRPVYQETILPNIAYIGGGGELAYWLQLRSGFDYWDVPFPALMLRNGGMLITAGNKKAMDKANITLSQLFDDTEKVLVDLVKEKADEELSLVYEKENMISVFDRILEKGLKIDQSVVQFAKAEKNKLIKSIDTVEKKLIRAEKKNKEVELNRYRKLKDSLFPNDGLQERHDNFFQYAQSQGVKMIDDIIEAFDPFSPDITIFQL